MSRSYLPRDSADEEHDLQQLEVLRAQVGGGEGEAALRHVPAARLVAAPPWGMKYLSRDLAFAKLRALTEGARAG